MSLIAVVANKLLNVAKTGTPMRHARGVVVSSNMGQTVVTIDGGATQLTAFNYGHTQSLAANTVVDLLLVGRKAYVIGAYGGSSALPGEILMGGWPIASPPVGTLACNGATYTSAAYPALYAAIGHGYGGTGTSFQVPNFQTSNSMPLGASSGTAPGSTGGSAAHTHTVGHDHTLAAAYGELFGQTNILYFVQRTGTGGWNADAQYNGGTTSGSSATGITGGLDIGGTTDTATPTSSAPNQGRPPYVAVSFVIKT